MSLEKYMEAIGESTVAATMMGISFGAPQAATIPAAISLLASHTERINECNLDWQQTAKELKKLCETLEEAEKVTPPEAWSADDRDAYEKERAELLKSANGVTEAFKGIGDGTGNLATLSGAGAEVSVWIGRVMMIALIAALALSFAPTTRFIVRHKLLHAVIKPLLLIVRNLVTKKGAAATVLASIMAAAGYAYLQRTNMQNAVEHPKGGTPFAKA